MEKTETKPIETLIVGRCKVHIYINETVESEAVYMEKNKAIIKLMLK
ncbi:hypothetical protein [Bacillus sp. T33-2]|nr:hypothetical protein [Bacillus sp. T33-2]